jgi:cytochrome P450
LNAGVKQFAKYFEGINFTRRSNLVGDLASTIANGRIDGRPLDEVETFGYYVIVATAGHDITSSSLAALIEYPDQLQLLKEDPKLIDTVVDEMIRWVTPVQHFLRCPQSEIRNQRVRSSGLRRPTSKFKYSDNSVIE